MPAPSGYVLQNTASIYYYKRLGHDYFLESGGQLSGYVSDHRYWIQEGYLSIQKNRYRFLVGRTKENLGSINNNLTSGSLIVSPNALPVPKISFSLPQYKTIDIHGIAVGVKGGIAHGWLDKGVYDEAPYLHEKWLYLRLKNERYSLSLGLVDEAQWGGSTKENGKQPDSFSDFIRVFFGAPGPKTAIKNEQINSLGNHLGIWDLRIGLKKSDYDFTFYFQHPFEDHSGANWLLNYKDGLWGILYQSQLEDRLIDKFVLEFLYTMDQSGSEGASDSTYGWDDYYNNYLYIGGWVYSGRVIGTPLFTLGINQARDWNHIENNRVIGIHTGVMGEIASVFHYRALLTYTRNYGTYFDRNQSKLLGNQYKYRGGISQFSWRYDIGIPIYSDQSSLSVVFSMAGDKGELFNDTNGYSVTLNWVFSYF